MGVIRNLFDIRAGEWPRFSLLFAAFFIFSVGAVWADSSTRTVVGNSTVGENLLANAQIYYGITTILVSIVYTAFVDRIAKPTLLLIMTLASVVAVLFGLGIVLLGFRLSGAMTLYVLSEVILLIWVLQWKTNLLDFYDTRASKRILPLLGVSRLLGLSVGGFTYPVLTTRFNFGPEAIFALWVGTLLFVFAILFALPRILRDPKPEKQEAEGGYFDSIRDGFTYIGRSRYLKWMAVSSVLMNALIALFLIVSTDMVTDVFRQTTASVEQAEKQAGDFFALIRGYASLVMLLVQLFVFPRILKRFGLGNTNLIYPFSTLGIAIWVGLVTLNPVATGMTLMAAGAAQISIKSYRRVFRTPVNGLLVNAVPSYMKGRARSVINGIISPFANITIGLLLSIQTLTIGGRVIDNTLIFTAIGLLVAIGYVITAFVLRREYTQELLKLLSAEDYTALLNEDYELGVADNHTLRQLHQRIRESDDPDFKFFIATLMLQMGDTAAVPFLVRDLQKSDTESQYAIMRAIVESEVRGGAVRQFYINYINAEHHLLRRTALTGLVNMTDPHEDVLLKIATDHLHDPDHQVRAQMVKTLLLSNDSGHQDRAARTLRAMLTDYDEQVRVATVRVMVEIGDLNYIRQFVRLMEDDSDKVRLAATIGVEKLWRDDMPKEISQLILQREKILLDDPIERIRLAELGILAKISNRPAAKALVRALLDSSPEIRMAAQDALAGFGERAVPPLERAVQLDNPDFARRAALVLYRIKPEQYETLVQQQIGYTIQVIYENYGCLSALGVCQQYPSFEVLRVHYSELIVQLRDELFHILYALYDDASVRTIYETLQSENSRTRVNAVEALESLSSPEIARQIAPLYDPDSTDQSLAELAKSYDIAIPSTESLIRSLATGKDRWLRAVVVMALGEMAADHPSNKNLFDTQVEILDNHTPSLCQQAINPKIVSITVRAGLESQDPDVRRAARAAVRMVKHQKVTDIIKQMEERSAVLSTIERMIYLKRVPFFQSLSVEQLKAVANICDEEFFKNGVELFQKGDTGGSLYIIISGKVDVGLRSSGGEDFTVLYTYGVNSAFGEMSLFDGRPRSADARATEDTLALTLRREPFLKIARRFPDLPVNLITMLSDRLRQANEQIARLNSSMRNRMDV